MDPNTLPKLKMNIGTRRANSSEVNVIRIWLSVPLLEFLISTVGFKVFKILISAFKELTVLITLK